MYQFYKVKIKEKIILAIVIRNSKPELLNFCTILRAKYFKNANRINPSPSMKELNNLKKWYQDSLKQIILCSGYVLVDISNGEIINPASLKADQILEEYKASLPF